MKPRRHAPADNRPAAVRMRTDRRVRAAHAPRRRAHLHRLHLRRHRRRRRHLLLRRERGRAHRIHRTVPGVKTRRHRRRVRGIGQRGGSRRAGGGVGIGRVAGVTGAVRAGHGAGHVSGAVSGNVAGRVRIRSPVLGPDVVLGSLPPPTPSRRRRSRPPDRPPRGERAAVPREARHAAGSPERVRDRPAARRRDPRAPRARAGSRPHGVHPPPELRRSSQLPHLRRVQTVSRGFVGVQALVAGHAVHVRDGIVRAEAQQVLSQVFVPVRERKVQRRVTRARLRVDERQPRRVRGEIRPLEHQLGRLPLVVLRGDVEQSQAVLIPHRRVDALELEQFIELLRPTVPRAAERLHDVLARRLPRGSPARARTPPALRDAGIHGAPGGALAPSRGARRQPRRRRKRGRDGLQRRTRQIGARRIGQTPPGLGLTPPVVDAIDARDDARAVDDAPRAPSPVAFDTIAQVQADVAIRSRRLRRDWDEIERDVRVGPRRGGETHRRRPFRGRRIAGRALRLLRRVRGRPRQASGRLFVRRARPVVRAVVGFGFGFGFVDARTMFLRRFPGEPGEVVEGAAPLRRLVRRPREEVDGPRVAHEREAHRRGRRASLEPFERGGLVPRHDGGDVGEGESRRQRRLGGVPRVPPLELPAVGGDAEEPDLRPRRRRRGGAERELGEQPASLGLAQVRFRRLLLGQADAPGLAHAAAYDAADPPRVGRRRLVQGVTHEGRAGEVRRGRSGGPEGGGARIPPPARSGGRRPSAGVAPEASLPAQRALLMRESRRGEPRRRAGGLGR